MITLYTLTVNNNDSFNIFKPKILTAIDKIKGKKKRADIDSIHDFIAQTEATNIDKNNIKDFVTKLIAEKLVIKKKTPQGYESNHKISYFIRTPTKENFNKTSEEVEFGIQTDFVFNNIYVKNDVFDTFYEDYRQYKGYVNDIINTLIPKEDSLHRTEKENTEHRKNIELLENQSKDLKRENQILKEILTSKFEKNNDSNSNGSKTFEKTNTNNTWKVVKTNRVNSVDNKGNNREFNPISVKNKYQPIFIGENEVTEPHIDDKINNDVNQNNNAYNNNINNNVTVRRKRPTPVINQFPERERDILGTNITKQSKSIIPGNTKYNEAVHFGRKAYVLGTSMVKGIRRNELNSNLKKCNTRFRPFIGATIKQMETYVKPIIYGDTPDVVILHIECNDISNRNMSANDIVEGIINIGRLQRANINDVIISSLICRTQHNLQNNVNAVNAVLMHRCKIYGLGYIDNSNIKVECLAQDGLHLNEIGKCCLANNFINF